MERLWFSPKQKRRITLRSAALLVGKAPTKAKRIKMQVTMPLTGQPVVGFPDWLADARDFVMKSGETVDARQIINHVNISMGDESLFQKATIEAPKSRLSNMVIFEMGAKEDPVTVLQFQILTQFSTDLFRWCGQMGGEEFDSAYELTSEPQDAAGDELELTGEAEEEDDPDDEDDDDEIEDEEEDELEGQERRAADRATRKPEPIAAR